VFALDLMSAYEGEHTIFGLLGQANLTQNDVLQFYPFILADCNEVVENRIITIIISHIYLLGVLKGSIGCCCKKGNLIK
jgi:hypothetical protein